MQPSLRPVASASNSVSEGAKPAFETVAYSLQELSRQLAFVEQFYFSWRIPPFKLPFCLEVSRAQFVELKSTISRAINLAQEGRLIESWAEMQPNDRNQIRVLLQLRDAWPRRSEVGTIGSTINPPHRPELFDDYHKAILDLSLAYATTIEKGLGWLV